MNSGSNVKTVILLWSVHSESCSKLRQMMTEDDLRLFEKICIDNPEIRQAVIESSKIQIKYVPCFLLIGERGQILSKFESNDAFQWFESIRKQKNPGPTEPQTGSSVDKILAGLKSMSRTVDQSDLIDQSLTGIQSRASGQITRPRPGADLGKMPRRPFSVLGSDYETEEDAMPSRPVRGQGHDNMLSSLSDFGQQPEERSSGMRPTSIMETDPYNPIPEQETSGNRMVSVGKGKRAIVIEDLTPSDEPNNNENFVSLDTDPSGMGIPRGDIQIKGEPQKKSTNSDEILQRGSMGGRGKEKGKAIKEAASAMAAQRDAEMEHQHEVKQGKTKQAKGSARGTPITV